MGDRDLMKEFGEKVSTFFNLVFIFEISCSEEKATGKNVEGSRRVRILYFFPTRYLRERVAY